MSAFDYLLVGVKANKLAFFGNVQTLRVAPLEASQARLNPVPEDVSHGHQFDVGRGLEGITGGPGAAASATHHADLDGVAAGRMNRRSKSQVRCHRSTDPSQS